LIGAASAVATWPSPGDAAATRFFEDEPRFAI
jgi:hypothetical protein